MLYNKKYQFPVEPEITQDELEERARFRQTMSIKALQLEDGETQDRKPKNGE